MILRVENQFDRRCRIAAAVGALVEEGLEEEAAIRGEVHPFFPIGYC